MRIASTTSGGTVTLENPPPFSSSSPTPRIYIYSINCYATATNLTSVLITATPNGGSDVLRVSIPQTNFTAGGGQVIFPGGFPILPSATGVQVICTAAGTGASMNSCSCTYDWGP